MAPSIGSVKLTSDEITWDLEFDEPSGKYIGRCPQLRQVAQGDTPESLEVEIGGVMDALLRSLLDSGMDEVTRFMKSCGVKLTITTQEPHVHVAGHVAMFAGAQPMGMLPYRINGAALGAGHAVGAK